MSEQISGRVLGPRNLSADAAGSIHDDAIATDLGFRGGTVAGNIHMDHFPPVLIEAFGAPWFETGSLSLDFRHATTDGELVQPHVDRPSGADDEQVRAWMTMATPSRATEERVVAEGSASVGEPVAPSALHDRDLRPGDPGELRILADVPTGLALSCDAALVDGARQRLRIEQGGCVEPLDWYTGPSPWGGPIASPLTVVELLYHPATRDLERRIKPAVGLFGAIEIRFLSGPVRLDHAYTVRGEVVAVGRSPKTEYVWFDTVASDEHGVDVAALRMQTRLLTASSPLYDR